MGYIPTITILPGGYIRVTSAGAMTYKDLVQILGHYNFKVNSIYLYCLDLSQLVQPIALKHLKIMEIKQCVVSPWIDPYQASPSLYVSTKDVELILDGFSTLNFTLNGNNRLVMVLDTDAQANSDILDAIHYGGNQEMINE